jgi:dTDP-4-amino-4,6-dideoxygalactose transaminase
MIHHSKPSVNASELAALKKVLSSGHLAMGKEVAALERELCAFVGHRHGLAVSSGTAALFGALTCLDVAPGDLVIIPSYACTALANAVCLAGATPLLCDVEDSSGLMSTATVKKVLKKKVRAIIVPHLFGYPAPAYEIEKETGIPVIEDCAQCIGAAIDGKFVGSLTTIAIFSFYATKVLCAGEGGLIATSSSRLTRRLEGLREYDNRPSWRPWFNFKCSDLQAAVARIQLRKLPGFIGRRRSFASQYDSVLDSSGSVVPFPVVARDVKPIYYRYLIRVRPGLRRKITEHFEEKKIVCSRPVFKPFHTYLKQKGFPVTERLYRELLSIPCYPALSDTQVIAVKKALSTLPG